MIARAIAAITAGAAAGAALARLQRKPEQPAPAPAVTRSITTYVEHDAANIHATPAPIEPAEWMNVMARNNAGVYTAYRRHGYSHDEAYGLMCIHIQGSYIQGGRK